MPPRTRSAKLHLWSGQVLHRVGRHRAAAGAYRRAVARDGRHSGWFRRLGAEQEASGDVEGALRSYEAALALDEAASASHFALARCLRRSRGAPPGPPEDWGGVAAAYREALARPDPDPAYHAWLGIALQRLGDWHGAAAAFAVAANELDDARWRVRLGAACRHLEDWAASRTAYRAAAVLEPQQASHRYWAGVAAQHLEDWAAAADEFRAATALDPTQPEWFARLGICLQQVEDWAGAADALRIATQSDDVHASWFSRLGTVLMGLREWEESASAFERAIELGAGDAQLHHQLGQAYEQFGPPEVAVSSRVGLRLVPGGRWADAARCYAAASQLEPRRTRHWLRLGAVRERLGELEGAAAAYQQVTELTPRNPAGWFRSARVVEATANRRGGYRPDDLLALDQLLGRAVELDPEHLVARQHRIRALIRARRWRDASEAGWYPSPASGDPDLHQVLRGYLEQGGSAEVTAVAAALARPDADLRGVPYEWWFVLHWRLLSEGHATLAYRAKAAMASQAAEDPARVTRGALSATVERGRALAHLGRCDVAIAELEAAGHEASSIDDALVLRKLAADLRLLGGDVEAHRSLLEVHEGTSSAGADERFRALIRGRRVAVVGPADSTHEHGHEIDSFDVVIRTKFARLTAADDGAARFAGSRTDLSYYALASVGLLSDDIEAALASGELAMAVFRPPAHALRVDRTDRPDVRYMPSEYAAHFRASQFAIQRILYDTLRYEPAEVKVFNINFFVAATEYRSGYMLDPRELQARGVVPPLAAFGHDFLADFVFTRRLVASGLVGCDPEVRRLVELTPEEYLRALDAKSKSAGHSSG